MGGHVIKTERIHTPMMILPASFLDLRTFEYLMGWEIAKYLSMEMAQRDKIEAVHNSTSSEIQASHSTHPSSQTPGGRKIRVLSSQNQQLQ